MQTLRWFFLLVGTIVQFRGNNSEELEEKEWWETALIYQIWPRAFQDSDGDGEGDLQGIINRLDYIKDLGVDAIWLNPIYESPWFDSGYDITDHNKIHPTLGDEEDIESLIEEAHERDLKVILDIVPNYSSIEHSWFNLSRAEIEPYDDFYIWANGTVDDSDERIEPNDWTSVYDEERNGSAWTWDAIREQWYYHKFHHLEPDLNLRNEDVVKKILETLDFWLEKGVDGFFFSSVSYYFEDEDLDDDDDDDDDDGNINDNDKLENGKNKADDDDNNNDSEERTIELLHRFWSHVDNWTKENNSTAKLLIVSSGEGNGSLISSYDNETETGIVTYNDLLIRTINSTSDADDIKKAIDDWMDMLPENSTTNWPLTNHDNSRTPSRMDDENMDGLEILSLLLPGQTITYYGEEISMIDTQVSWSDTIDPMACENPQEDFENNSRDRARTPMQWNSSLSAGFSSSNETFLPVNPLFEDINVEDQVKEPFSSISIYKKVALLRKESPVFTHGDYELESENENRILILKRFLEGYPTYIAIINLESFNETVNLTELYPELEDTFEVVISTDPDIDTAEIESEFVLSGNEAVVLKGRADVNESTTSVFDEKDDEVSNEDNKSQEDIIEESNENVNKYETGGATIISPKQLTLYWILFFIFRNF